MTAKRIRIRVGSTEVGAGLDVTQTAESISKALPIRGTVCTWGNEIYFSTALNLPREDPKETVQAGELGYWPPGKAFCIFFGPTPASIGDDIRPASPVNVFGRITGDAKVFKEVEAGAEVVVEAVDGGQPQAVMLPAGEKAHLGRPLEIEWPLLQHICLAIYLALSNMVAVLWLLGHRPVQEWRHEVSEFAEAQVKVTEKNADWCEDILRERRRQHSRAIGELTRPSRPTSSVRFESVPKSLIDNRRRLYNKALRKLANTQGRGWSVRSRSVSCSLVDNTQAPMHL